MENRNDLEGFDPLGSNGEQQGSMSTVFEEASRRIVQNILNCYTGYFDLFSEMIQNSLDAVDIRRRAQEPGYRPTIWIEIDIPDRRVRIVDNGVGMSRDEFKFCLRPNVSFKREARLRGQKGVGATFLAYGFSFLRLQSKKERTTSAAILRQGRQWADDSSSTIPRPTLSAADFGVSELASETSGTCVEIVVGNANGERPKNLGWLGAQTAQQWFDVLRIKTPLGGVYLSTATFHPTINIQVRGPEGTVTSFTSDRPEYYYPHEIPNLKAQTLGDIQRAMKGISGDAQTVFTKLDSKFKRLDSIWEVWGKDQILAEDSPFFSALTDEHKLLIERHNAIVYACFLRSAKLWGEFNDEVLKLRKGQRIIQGGLQIASDFMPQGELTIIPLTSTIGYQANSHVIVHFTDGRPDIGRKTFQPELTSLAEILSVRAVNVMKRFLLHMKPDTGASTLTPEKELHEWKKSQEAIRERNQLSFVHSGQQIALISKPQQEQDVIALFHELIGMGLLKGFRIYATCQHERYDSLFYMDYPKQPGVHFDMKNARLGVTRQYALPFQTEPKVLEYKYSFDSLISDFDKEEKFARQIDLVVCWNVGGSYKEKFYLQSLLVGDEGSSRRMFGSTHQAIPHGTQEVAFEVLMLDDLLRWLQSPEIEEARQKSLYTE